MVCIQGQNIFYQYLLLIHKKTQGSPWVLTKLDFY
jgi:hypothetical protein